MTGAQSPTPTTGTSSAGRTAVRAALVLVTLVLAIAVALRLVALDRMLPHVVEPDAFWAYHLMEMRGEVVPDGVDYRERYPSLVPTLLARFAPPTALASVDDALAAAAQPFVLVRGVAAMCGVLLAFLTWRLARRCVDRWTALVAAALVAISPLALLCSTQARPHAVVAAGCAVTVLACVRLVERTSVWRLVCASAAAGLAIASLQNGVFALTPLAVAAWMAYQGWRRWVMPMLACTGALAAGLVWWPSLPQLVDGAVRLGGSGAHELAGAQYDGQGFLVAARLLFEHDPWLAPLAALGTVVLALRMRRTAVPSVVWLLLAHALPYAVVSGLNREFYERFLLPLLPVFCISAAVALTWLVQQAAARGGAPWVAPLRALALGVVLLSVALPLAGAAAWWRLSSTPDSVEEALTQLPSGSVATTPVLALPALLDDASLQALAVERDGHVVPWIAWQAAHRQAIAHLPNRAWRPMPARVAKPGPDDTSRCDAWLAEVQPQVYVAEVSRRTTLSPAAGRLYLLAGGGTDARLEQVVLTYQAIPHYFRRLLEAKQFGPPLVWAAR